MATTEYMREYTRKNKDRINEQRSKRNAIRSETDPTFRQQANARNAKYYSKNKEIILERAKSKNWYYDPVGRVSIRRKYYEKNWRKISINSARGRAKKAGLPFNLDLEWFDKKFAKGCEVTGLPLEPTGNKTPWTVHVDRKVPSLGYTKDNCRLVCATYNLAKRHWTDEDVLKMARNLIRTSDA